MGTTHDRQDDSCLLYTSYGPNNDGVTDYDNDDDDDDDDDNDNGDSGYDD